MKQRSRAAEGFTLMELIVAVAIVSFMVLGFGKILTSTQEMVTTTQQMTKANGAASGILDVIRTDLKKASALGFLYVGGDGTTSVATNAPMLAFVASGHFSSLTCSESANAAIVSYGLATNHADGEPTGTRVLFRQGLLLSNTLNDPGNESAFLDRIPADFGTIQTLPPDNLKNIWLLGGTFNLTPDNIPNRNIYYPPAELSQINSMWQLLAGYAKRFQVWWWDSTTNSWNAQPRIWAKGESWVYSAGTGWTLDSSIPRPTMLRIRFLLHASKDKDIEYEIIASVGQ